MADSELLQRVLVAALCLWAAWSWLPQTALVLFRRLQGVEKVLSLRPSEGFVSRPMRDELDLPVSLPLVRFKDNR